MKKIILIGVGCVVAKYLPKSLRKAGYEPIILIDPTQYTGMSRTELESCECHSVDITSIEAIRTLFLNNPSIVENAVAITGVFDELYPIIELLGEEYNLDHPEPAIARLSEKSYVSSLVPEFCPQGVDFKESNLTAIEGFKSSASELIIKPSLSSGALGFKIINNNDKLIQTIKESVIAADLGESTDWLLQEKIEGSLVSFEGFIHEGQVHSLGISLRGRIGATEVSNQFPAEEKLADAAVQRCHACVETLTQRAELKNGYFHCEFIATDESAYLIDANIGRIGGASVVEQVALAYQLAPEDILHHVILLPLQKTPIYQVPEYKLAQSRQLTLSIWYGMPHTAAINAVNTGSLNKCQHTQFALAGNTVPVVGTSDYSWIGMLTGLYQDTLEEIKQFTINTSLGLTQPAFVVVD